MVGETVTETWFVSIWKSSRKSMSWEPEKPVLGILAFEISRLMSKLVNIWQCLSDRQIVRLKEEFANSIGIQKLISGDEDYLMDLALAEIIENLSSVAKSVAVLGKKCTDPTYHNLERIFDRGGEIDPKFNGWQYKLKKMEKKVKKMEKFVGSTEQLYQEIEVLAELEQTLRRMRAGADSGQVKLLEFQQKVVWQRQEVKNLREMSPWVKTYDHIVRLLLRSVFTIVERIKSVYGTGNVGGSNDYEHVNNDCLVRRNSISALMQTPVYPSETRFSVPLGRSFSNIGFSKNTKTHRRSHSSLFNGKQNPVRGKIFTPVGFTGCMTSGSESPVVENTASSCSTQLKDIIAVKNSSKLSFLNTKRRLMNAPPSTLGYSALTLHYANVIILIEKLSSTPHLISLDARDDLYNMLPGTIRSSLRSKLKAFSRNFGNCVYDAAFAGEWSLALARILEWLSPLAHSTVRWHSERNFERQRLSFGSNVLLVQTLYFANRAETEAAIVELLMGLNYLSRFGGEMSERPLRESSCSRAYDGYMFHRDNLSCKMIEGRI